MNLRSLLLRIESYILPRTPLALFISALFGFSASASALLLLWPWLTSIPLAYSDLVTGFLTWHDDPKQGELYISFIVIGTFVLAFVGSAALMNRFPAGAAVRAGRTGRRRRQMSPHRRIYGTLALSASFFLAFCLTREALWYPGAFLLGGMGLAALACFGASARYRSPPFYRSLSVRFAGAFLLPVFAAFSCLAILTGCFLLSGGEWRLTPEAAAQLCVAVFCIASLSGAFLAFRFLPRQGARVLAILVVAAQLPLPLFLLRYTRVPLNTAGGFMFVQGRVLLDVVIWGVIALSALTTTRQLMRIIRSSDRHLSTHKSNFFITWPTVCSLASLAFSSHPGFSILSSDDFHLGETLIVWQQIFDFGQRQYQDFVSVQGLIGIYYGFFHHVFFDGTVASYTYAFPLAQGVLIMCAAALARRVFGGLMTLAILPMMAPVFDRAYFVSIVLFILLFPQLIVRRFLWCVVYVVLALVHLYWNTSAGAALSLALAPFALIQFVLFLEEHRGRLLQVRPGTFGLLGGIVLLISAWLFLPVFTGLLQFLKDNGSTNTPAYGISLLHPAQSWPMLPSWSAVFPQRLFWETFRIGGWMICAMLLFSLFCAARIYSSHGDRRRTGAHSRSETRLFSLAMVAGSGMLFALAMTPYTMTRVDPQFLSRTGAMSLLMLTFFLPLTALLAYRVAGRHCVAPVLLGTILGFSSSFGGAIGVDYVGRALAVADVTPESSWIDGSALGLPQLGSGHMPVARVEQIQRFQRELQALIDPGETYYDLTNRSAFYFFLNRKVPAGYSASYLAANEPIGARVIQQLEREQPPVVWVSPEIPIDGPPPSLRSYRIYRWLILNDYRSYTAGEFTFLVKADRLRQRGLPVLSLEDEIKALAEKFFVPKLNEIPRAWGRGMPALLPRFKEFRNLPVIDGRKGFAQVQNSEWNRVVERRASLGWKLDPPVQGSDADFLLITLERRQGTSKDSSPPHEARGEISWVAEGEDYSPSRSYRFEIFENGDFLIPLGAAPSWLLNPAIVRIRLQIANSPKGEEWSVRQLRLLQLEH